MTGLSYFFLLTYLFGQTGEERWIVGMACLWMGWERERGWIENNLMQGSFCQSCDCVGCVKVCRVSFSWLMWNCLIWGDILWIVDCVWVVWKFAVSFCWLMWNCLIWGKRHSVKHVTLSLCESLQSQFLLINVKLIYLRQESVCELYETLRVVSWLCT
jgi:hypothetical protein